MKYDGIGYQPVYTRAELTDALHDAFGFCTSKQIVPIAKMKNFCSKTKKIDSVTCIHKFNKSLATRFISDLRNFFSLKSYQKQEVTLSNSRFYLAVHFILTYTFI